MKKNLRTYLCLTASFIVLSGGVSCCTEETVIEVTDISLDKTSIDIARGSTMTLQATVLPDNATDKTIIWDSKNPEIATVTQEGVVDAIAIGTTTVSAQAGGKIAVCRINVIGKPAETVTVTPQELSILKEETSQLNAEIFPADADQKDIEWSTSDSTVAIVSQDGTVSAISVGKCTIYATCGDASGQCSVTVEGIPAESIAVTPEVAEVLLGGSIRLTASVQPDNADYETIQWTTSDESIATVAQDGTVTGKAIGTVTITATTGDISGSSEITVVQPQAKVGDLYYSDGTWSTEPDPQKQIIGVIFYVGQHENDASDYSESGIGKSRCNGYAMALTNATDQYCYWGPENGEDLGCYPIDENGNIVDNYTNGKECDWSGYKYTQIIKEAAQKNGGPAPDQASTYPAIFYTLDYENTVPSPESCSGWFLPAISQTYTLIENSSLLEKAGASLPTDWYYSSSEDSWALDMVLSINMSTMTVRSNWKESKVNLIRPILAF